jgi:hypothetical protein
VDDSAGEGSCSAEAHQISVRGDCDGEI